VLFKTTQEILSNPWDTQIRETTVHLPPKIRWDKLENMSISDVELWEQIYYQPGNVGIYAAWTPYAELYMIVYDLFADEEKTIKTFIGNTASNDVFKKAQELGIDLSTHQIWVPEILDTLS
jgi:hypothetical protein